MSVSSVSAQNSAYTYLQSLLPSGGGSGTSDPVSQLLEAFYPNGGGPAPAATQPANTSVPSGMNGPDFSADTMASLISMQGQCGSDTVAARAQSLFGQFDTNGDGQISKSEFEGVFGANADTSKVDGLFNTLDANGDGSVSQDEMTAAAQQSRAHHHHHHMQGQGGGLSSLLSSLDPAGATAQTASNADGSSSTTITYADGSTVTMTTPAGSGTSGDQTNAGPGSGSSNNLLEQLIRLQAQFLTPSPSQTLATV
jgi:hypothetical protein